MDEKLNDSLINAAPELLLACKCAASLCSISLEYGAGHASEEYLKVLKLCDDAIAKAEGKQS